MEPPRKKNSLSHLAAAFVVSCLGFLACAVFVFLLWEHHGWVEKERIHPTANPVFYSAALEMVHYGCYLMIPFLGAISLLTCFFIWRHYRDSARRD
jgi:hypothetical protein